MKWAEIQTRGIAYSQARGTPKAEDPVKKQKADKTEVIFGIPGLGVREALTAIKDEVWGEGRVEPFQEGEFYEVFSTRFDGAGLVLISDPYTFLHISGSIPLQSLSGTLEERRMALAVSTTFLRFGESDENAYVHLWEKHWHNHLPGTLDVRDLIAKKGLGEAMNLVERNVETQYNSAYLGIMESWHPYAQDLFFLCYKVL